ncbi:hypothetical protein N9A25_00140 [bacterium]|nr:hypothetical protein [bacterium]
MQNDYEYYFNDVPGVGLCRNNLIYTSLVNKDMTQFVQWYYNDGEYHKGQNEVLDPNLMEEKFKREVIWLTHMRNNFPEHVPNISKIDLHERKIYLEIEGLDFWNRAGCLTENYDKVLPDWQDQMLEIIRAHKSLGLHKYSMHPSSYFVVDGKLKSINYFFAYRNNEPLVSIADVESHIYSTRQDEMRKHLATLGIEWDKPQPWEVMDKLCWNSFRTNYPADFIDKVLNV